jgi:FkbM family methyltransferase
MTEQRRGIKKLLRAVLPKNGYDSLAKLHRRLNSSEKKSLHKVKRILERRPVNVEVMLDLKNDINITGKLDYASQDIYLHIDSMVEYETRLHSCAKEPDTVEWVEKSMKPGDVFYDVGANVGAYSLVAAKYFGGAVKVYAFEPAFFNFSQLCRNLMLNKCEQIVVPLSVALSDKTTIGDFNYHSLASGDSLHTFGEAVDFRGSIFKPLFVQAMLSYRLDDLIEQFRIPKPTHIKIDVDGIEKAVLEGGPNTLSSLSLRSIVVELEEGPAESEITELLAEKSFELDSKHSRWTPGMVNCIFTRKNP